MPDPIQLLEDDPRVLVRRGGAPDPEGSCVVYWMQRSQRAFDNPALNVAIEAANVLAKPVVVFFAPVPFYPHANLRHYSFLAEGVSDIEAGLARRRVGLVFRPWPEHRLLPFLDEVRPALLVGDENPMREPEQWREKLARRVKVPFWTVDADVIVPSRLMTKEHYAARTIRPRIHEQLERFLVPPGNPVARLAWKAPRALKQAAVTADFLGAWKIDRSVSAVGRIRGGSAAAMRVLRTFLTQRLTGYPERRNHPEIAGTSGLSPYLHFGQIGPHTVALAVQRSNAPKGAKDAFLEQLIVRRELAINFVRFNADYDNLESLEEWARRSLAQHARDPRPVIYDDRQLEAGETGDPLWNGAQRHMVLTGWMHNYLRMYWAKKLLEWSPSVAVAYHRAVEWNDKYELDGRDPNGYAGIAWALVGKHDRPWFERPVFGQIRSMSYEGARRKFDVDAYVQQIASERERQEPQGPSTRDARSGRRESFTGL